MPTTIKGNAPYSFSAWVLAQSTPNENECIIDVNESYNELSKIILGYGTSPRSGITMHYGWYEDMGLSSLPTVNTWNHIVVTFDGYLEKIYLNGHLVKSKDIYLRVGSSEKLTLGMKFDGEHPFRGALHSLSMYDIPLSENQVLELYQNINNN